MFEINNLTDDAIDKKFKNEISFEKFKNEISFEKFLKKVAKIVIKGKSVKMKDISIVLVGALEIRKLNKKYRRKDKATDVLSFNYGDSGEVVLCPEVIKENAEKFGNTFKKEIIRILIHGMLHLAGYDHEKSTKEAEKMETKEKHYIKLLT